MLDRSNLTLLWVLTRSWAALCGLQLFPYPHRENLFSDVRLYDWWAGNITNGHFPINDPMWQYPPLAAVIFALGYLIARNTIGFLLLALICDGATQWLLYSRGVQRRNALPAQIWLVMPLLVGPIALGRFDVFPTATAVAALLGAAATSGRWIAVGALLKVWPGLGLIAMPRVAWKSSGTWFVVTATVLSTALLAWWPGSFSFLSEQKARGLQVESVGALPYVLWSMGPSVVQNDFRYGALEVVAQGTGLVSLAMTVLFVISLGQLTIWRIQGRIDEIPPSHIFLTAVLSAMVTSRVLSPQYNLWVIGLLAACAFEQIPRFIVVARLLMVSTLCGQVLYPWLYGNFLMGGVLPALVQALRIATLLWATALCWNHIIKNRRPASPIRQVRP
jgi:hypothetical protein